MSPDLPQKDPWSVEPTQNDSEKVEEGNVEAENESSGGFVSRSVVSKFEQQFGIKPADLESIEGFTSLPKGQQLLILENLKQITLGRIHDEAREAYTQQVKEASDPSEDSDFLSKAIRTFKRADLIFSKDHITRIHERNKAQEFSKGGIGFHREVLNELVRGYTGNPENTAFMTEHGYVAFARPRNPDGAEEYEAVDKFNKAAQELSKIPQEWEYETATDSENEKWGIAQKNYNEARQGLLSIREKQAGNGFDAAIDINNLDLKVHMQRLFTTNPDAEKELAILAKDTTLWDRIFVDGRNDIRQFVMSEKGWGFGLGTFSRSIIGAAGIASIVTLLPTAAGLGAIRGRARAKQELREDKIQARKGIQREGAIVEKYADAQHYASSIKRLTQQIAEASSAEENESGVISDKIKRFSEKYGFGFEEARDSIRASLIASLDLRAAYAMHALRNGTVNFGVGDEATKNKLDLIQAIAQARTIGGAIDDERYYKSVERMNKRLSRGHEKTEEMRKKYIKNKTMVGAAMGAGFFVGGKLLLTLSNELGWGDRIIQSIFGQREAEVSGGDVSQETVIGERPVTSGTRIDTVHTAFREPEVSPTPSQASMPDWMLREPDPDLRHFEESHTYPQENPFATPQEPSVPQEQLVITPETIDLSVGTTLTAEPGDNLWDMGHSLIGQQIDGRAVSVENFNEAWTNARITLANGQEVPMYQTDLIHPGDKVQAFWEGDTLRFRFIDDADDNAGLRSHFNDSNWQNIPRTRDLVSEHAPEFRAEGYFSDIPETIPRIAHHDIVYMAGRLDVLLDQEPTPSNLTSAVDEFRNIISRSEYLPDDIRTRTVESLTGLNLADHAKQAEILSSLTAVVESSEIDALTYEELNDLYMVLDVQDGLLRYAESVPGLLDPELLDEHHSLLEIIEEKKGLLRGEIEVRLSATPPADVAIDSQAPPVAPEATPNVPPTSAIDFEKIPLSEVPLNQALEHYHPALANDIEIREGKMFLGTDQVFLQDSKPPALLHLDINEVSENADFRMAFPGGQWDDISELGFFKELSKGFLGDTIVSGREASTEFLANNFRDLTQGLMLTVQEDGIYNPASGSRFVALESHGQPILLELRPDTTGGYSYVAYPVGSSSLGDGISLLNDKEAYAFVFGESAVDYTTPSGNVLEDVLSRRVIDPVPPAPPSPVPSSEARTDSIEALFQTASVEPGVPIHSAATTTGAPPFNSPQSTDPFSLRADSLETLQRKIAAIREAQQTPAVNEIREAQINAGTNPPPPNPNPEPFRPNIRSVDTTATTPDTTTLEENTQTSPRTTRRSQMPAP